MSALQQIEDYVQEMWALIGPERPSTWTSGEQAQKLYDLVAHELAEKIREQITHKDDYKCVPCFIYWSVANHIDPEVES
jgi:hypothetical protein